MALFVNARHRAKLSHCRNNLRHLGMIAGRNWMILDPRNTGRAFWQDVREKQYKDVRGKWRLPDPDPFVCPVLGTTVSRKEDASAIDYRGPRTVRENWSDIPAEEPLGADRPGNHPSGLHVLLRDATVREVSVEIAEAFEGDTRWRDADRFLSD